MQKENIKEENLKKTEQTSNSSTKEYINIPVKNEVRGICELLGFDPLHLANEGKVLMVAGKRSGSKILDLMKKQKYGKDSAIIGRMVKDHPKKVKLITSSGGSRWVDLPAGEQLPRIC